MGPSPISANLSRKVAPEFSASSLCATLSLVRTKYRLEAYATLRRRADAVGAGRTPFETSLETPESNVALASSLYPGSIILCQRQSQEEQFGETS